MPLHWAASGGHVEIIEFLLKQGVPVDARDEVTISASFYYYNIHIGTYIL